MKGRFRCSLGGTLLGWTKRTGVAVLIMVIPIIMSGGEDLLANLTNAAPNDSAVLWRGFDQKWTTANHRLNRLGDFIANVDCGPTSCKADLVHAAASGLAGDTARYITYYSQIAAKGVGFQSGLTRIRLSGSEGKQINVEKNVSVTPDSNMKDRGEYVVVLNGFDLCATESADKLKYLYVAVTKGSYNLDRNKIEFKVIAKLTANCRSIECPPAKDDVDYEMRVHYVIIAGEETSFHTASQKFGRHYNWDKKDEIHLRDLIERHTIQGAAGYPSAALAFRWLEVSLDTDHWVFEWTTYIRPIQYSESGKSEFDLGLMFKQWTTGMRFGAQKREGSATMQARVILLQFKEARVKHDKYSGSIRWPGTEGGAPSGACSDDAMKTYELRFKVEL